MTEHDRVRMVKAQQCDRNSPEQLLDAIRGLQSTDDPILVSLHDELWNCYNRLVRGVKNLQPSLEPKKDEDIVRVLRVIEYVGPRNKVEEVVRRSIHGEYRCGNSDGVVVIRAATIGEFPEILQEKLNANHQEAGKSGSEPPPSGVDSNS